MDSKNFHENKKASTTRYTTKDLLDMQDDLRPAATWADLMGSPVEPVTALPQDVDDFLVDYMAPLREKNEAAARIKQLEEENAQLRAQVRSHEMGRMR